jgi:hypothetical protein
MIPEGDAQLGASLGQAEECITAVATDIAAGAATDFAFGHLAADIVLRAVGMKRNVWMGRAPWSGVRAVGKWPAVATAKSLAEAGHLSTAVVIADLR